MGAVFILNCVLCGGQVNPECAAFVWLGFQPDAAAHSLGGLFHDRQSNARAFVTFFNSLKDAEYFIVLSSFDSDAIVPDENPHAGFPFLAPDTDPRSSAR